MAKKKTTKSDHMMSVAQMKTKEAMMEHSAHKTMAETMMEKKISKATGKPYKGKR